MNPTKRFWMVAGLGSLLLGALPAVGAQEETRELKPVLLVMDVQNVWMPMMAEADREAALPKINEAIALFREYNYPVFRVYHSDPKRGPELGSEPFAFAEGVAVTDNDPMLVKRHGSAFTDTDLEQILRDAGHNTVFLCGLSATGCVLATYFGARDRDFLTVMIKDAMLSHNAEYTNVIEEICSTMSLEKVREALEHPTY